MADAGALTWARLERGRWVVAAVCVATSLALALPVAAWSWRTSRHSWWPLDASLYAFGVVAILIGYVAWIRLPQIRVGPIIVCLGATYYVQFLRASSDVVVFTAAVSLAYVWTALVAHLALALPTGRVTGLGNRTLLVCCYVTAVATQALRLVFDHPDPPWTPGAQLERTPTSVAGSVTVIIFSLLVVVVTVRGWVAASDARRRWRAPLWAALLLVAVPSSAASVANIVWTPVHVTDALLLAALGTGVLLVPIVLLVQSASTMRTRWQLVRVVLDRDRARELSLRPELLQPALAEALGDPTLRVAYPADDGRYVDADGRHLDLEDRHSRTAVGVTGRTVTRVEQAGELVALIEHDEVIDERQQVASTVAAVVGVAIENTRMLEAQIEQVRISRLRVSEAALEERRKLQRNLHDGTQQQFYAVLALLGAAKDQLDAGAPDRTGQTRDLVQRAHSQLHHALTSLQELVQGIYPTALTEHGLAATIEEVADTSAVPIEVNIPSTRWPGHVEVTAYFLIAETITNAYRHAQASQVVVRVHEVDDSQVQIKVSDDGLGGATFRPGGGLCGMRDRVTTVGGSLFVRSEPGEGTTVLATLPVEILIS